MTHPYREQALEAIARTIIKSHAPHLLWGPYAVPIEEIVERQYGLRVEYQYIRNNGRILGETAFDDAWVAVYDQDNRRYCLIAVKGGTIILDASLLASRGDGRLRFTLAHELAHWVLHQEIYAGSGRHAAMTGAPHKSSDADAFIERQADRLGTAILMPAGQVKMAFHQARNTHKEPVAHCADLFAVSRQAMKIRLTELCLLT
jgi:hypothetical protein